MTSYESYKSCAFQKANCRLPFRISFRINKDELRFPSEWIFGTFENKQAARNGYVGGDNNGVECDDFSETLRENYLEQAASSKMSQPM